MPGKLRIITHDDITLSLSQSGLGAEDSLFVSSSFGMIGKIAGDTGSLLTDIDAICGTFFKAIRDVIGPKGTVFAPAYSYTIGKHSAASACVFDPLETPADIGPFPNFLIQQPDSYRNLDPMVSVVGVGPAAKSILSNSTPSSYGKDSVFERLLHLKNMKVCNIGLGPNWTPFIHYADYLAEVPFRYEKLFLGPIKENEVVEERPWIYQVPARIPHSFGDAHHSGKLAAEKGIFSSSMIGRARIFTASYREYFDFALENLAKNKWWHTRGPGCDVYAEDAKRLPCYAGGHEFSAAPVSQSQVDRMGAVVSAIDGINAHTWKTGEWVSDWIIPERFETLEATVTDPQGQAQFDVQLAPYSTSFEGQVSGKDLKERAAQYHARTKPFWLLRDWAFQNTGALSDTQTYDVVIRSDTGLGTMMAVVLKRSGTTNSPVIVLDSAGFPQLNHDEFAQLFAAIAKKYPSFHIATAPGDIGLAAVLSVSTPSELPAVIQLTSPQYDPSSHPSGVPKMQKRALMSGCNPMVEKQERDIFAIEIDPTHSLDDLNDLEISITENSDLSFGD